MIRYFPYFAPAFALMKELIVEMMHSAGQDDPGAAAAVRSLNSLEELYDAWGKVSLGAGRESNGKKAEKYGTRKHAGSVLHTVH